MPKPFLTFDLETVPDYAAIARAHGLPEDDIDAAKAVFGDKFPPPAYHRIVCIAALAASYEEDRSWKVREIVVHHAGEMDEPQIIGKFFETIEHVMPVLVSYNGLTFDLPVLQYRAMLHRVPGLHLARVQKYFQKFGDAHWDLCDLMSNFDGRNRLTLDALCRYLGIAGKIDGMDGSKVADLAAAGQFDVIAAYCRGDIAALHRLFLIREVFHNRLSQEGLRASLESLAAILARSEGSAEASA